MPINPSLLTSLLCFWSLTTNTFSFPEGYMTPTVFDVFALLGLRPMGAIAHPLMAVGTGPEDDFLKGVPMGYTEFIKHAKGTDASPVTYKEECLFYLYWICRFLACTSSKRVINYYLPIARCLANGVPVDMASFLLGELYRAMLLLSIEPKQSHEGPIWLIQMWPYSYFPSIAPELYPSILPWSYGEAWMHARFPKEKGIPSFPSCFKLFSDSSRRRSPEEFMPFEAKKYGSEDFRKFSRQGFFRGDSAWGACLQSRDLVVIRSNNAGVEAYCPSLVARQFGLVQLLPVPPIWTKNTDWMARAIVSKDEAKQISVLTREQITSFVFTPFSTRSLSSSLFHNWWEAYMANFNNEDNLIEALQRCCPEFLTYQLLGTFLLLFSFCLCCLFCLKHYVNRISFFQMLVLST
jgi:hypothetical protein